MGIFSKLNRSAVRMGEEDMIALHFICHCILVFLESLKKDEDLDQPEMLALAQARLVKEVIAPTSTLMKGSQINVTMGHLNAVIKGVSMDLMNELPTENPTVRDILSLLTDMSEIAFTRAVTASHAGYIDVPMNAIQAVFEDYGNRIKRSMQDFALSSGRS